MSKLEKVVAFGSVLAAAAPALVSAQIINLGGNASDAGSVTTQILNLLNSLVIPFIIGLGVVYFIYGVLKYIMNADNEEARKKAQDGMIYGIIGLVVMFSFWGLVAFLQRSFGLGAGGTTPQGVLPGIVAPTPVNNGGIPT